MCFTILHFLIRLLVSRPYRCDFMFQVTHEPRNSDFGVGFISTSLAHAHTQAISMDRYVFWFSMFCFRRPCANIITVETEFGEISNILWHHSWLLGKIRPWPGLLYFALLRQKYFIHMGKNIVACIIFIVNKFECF